MIIGKIEGTDSVFLNTMCQFPLTFLTNPQRLNSYCGHKHFDSVVLDQL